MTLHKISYTAAVHWRRCSRLGRASSPTVGERALPASQQIGNLGTWEVSRGALELDRTEQPFSFIAARSAH